MLAALKNITSVIFPKVCSGCNGYLDDPDSVICITCRHSLSMTDYHQQTENILARTLMGRGMVKNASAMFIFKKEGIVQHLIHNLKYTGQEAVGELLGKWYGSELQQSPLFSNVDMVIPVPLHPKKLRERGYNQVTAFSREIAKALEKPLNENTLMRLRYTKTQTFKNRVLRQYNQQVFGLNPDALVADKHILLVDDVITTGATIEHCVKALQQMPRVTVSVVAIAFTE